ncbi:CHC2 zinc finger domain-containing protein [Methylocystis hirsuta]|nr:CHC2 zinc finger domain-containing protein [Methylocystis hirsuta]
MSTAQLSFSELKERVNIEQVLPLIGITLKRHQAQLRGVCPICKEGGDRALVVTPAKGLYYCFGKCRTGGDMISLVARVKDCSVREAAEFIAERMGITGSRSKAEATVPRDSSPQPLSGKEGLKPLEYLQPSHEAVQALGVAAETCEHFAAGFAPKGMMRGRLAIPIHDRAGALLAYCGRTVKDETPVLIFPKDFRPDTVIFNSHRIEQGDMIYVARDPLQVLQAYEHGVTNVVSFLGDITVDALHVLALLMDEKDVPSIDLI